MEDSAEIVEAVEAVDSVVVEIIVADIVEDSTTEGAEDSTEAAEDSAVETVASARKARSLEEVSTKIPDALHVNPKTAPHRLQLLQPNAHVSI